MDFIETTDNFLGTRKLFLTPTQNYLVYVDDGRQLVADLLTIVRLYVVNRTFQLIMMDISSDESLQLRVGSIFLIFIVSSIGFFSPYIGTRYLNLNLETSFSYMLIKSYASGIILGVAMIHLLNDAVSDLSLYFEYPCKYLSYYIIST